MKRNSILSIILFTIIISAYQVVADKVLMNNQAQFIGVESPSQNPQMIKGIVATSRYDIQTWENRFEAGFLKVIIPTKPGIWATAKIYRSAKSQIFYSDSDTTHQTMYFDVFQTKAFHTPYFEQRGKQYLVSFERPKFTIFSLRNGFSLGNEIQASANNIVEIKGRVREQLISFTAIIVTFILIVLLIFLCCSIKAQKQYFPTFSVLININLTIILGLTQLHLTRINGNYYWMSPLLGLFLALPVVAALTINYKQGSVKVYTFSVLGSYAATALFTFFLPEYAPYLIPIYILGMCYENFVLQANNRSSILCLAILLLQSTIVFICYYQEPHPIGFDVRWTDGLIPMMSTLVTSVAFIFLMNVRSGQKKAVRPKNGEYMEPNSNYAKDFL